MNWQTERASLETLQFHPQANSTLKKKLAIINKLRNISSENFHQILIDIKTEDLHKFYTEIINGLLSNHRVQSHEDIHKLVRIIRLYSYDPLFVSQLTAILKKQYTDSWVNSAIFAEIYFMMHAQINPIVKSLVKACKENPLQLIHYLVCNFAGMELDYVKKRIAELSKTVREKGVDLLNSLCERLDMDIRMEPPTGYVEVVVLEEDEFSFYQGLPPEQKEELPDPELFSRAAELLPGCHLRRFKRQQLIQCMLKRIKGHPYDVRLLDLIGQAIHDSPVLISKLLRKRKHSTLLPAIARVLATAGTAKKELIRKLTGTSPEDLTPNDLLLIAELCKFGCIRHSSIFSLLSCLLTAKLIGRFCLLLENVGRFLLLQKASNREARELLDTVRQTVFSEMDRIQIDDCMAKIFKISDTHIDILHFVQWLFKRSNFSPHGLFAILSKSTRLLLLCFIQPEIFEDDEMLADVIEQTSMDDTMIQLYTRSIPVYSRQSNQQVFRMVSVLGRLLRSRPADAQSEVLEAVRNTRGISRPLAQSVLIMLLEHCSSSVIDRYSRILSEEGMSPRIRTDFFNLCERRSLGICCAGESDSSLETLLREIE